MSLDIRKMGEDTYELLSDIIVESLGYKITVKKGFDFDGASIPKAFWSIIGSPFTGNYTIPATIHDGLYASEILDRDICDNIFLDLMKQYNVGYVKRYTMYWAVRSAGWNVWRKHDKDEIEKYKGFINVKIIK